MPVVQHNAHPSFVLLSVIVNLTYVPPCLFTAFPHRIFVASTFPLRYDIQLSLFSHQADVLAQLPNNSNVQNRGRTYSSW